MQGAELSFADFAGGGAASSPAAQWKPPPGAPVNYVPTIDVTASGHPAAAMGQPGSQFAPSQISPGTKPLPNSMPVPTPRAPQGNAASAASAAGASSAAEISFADFAKAPGPAAGKQTGILANLGAGTSDAVAATLGAPVDLATGAMNLVPRGINAVAGTHLGTIQNPVGGSDWWRSAESLVGADPRNVVPGDQTEQLARAAGSGAASMILPFGAARALPAMSGIPGALQAAFGAGPEGALRGAMAQGAIGGVAGAGGQVAENAVPQPYKPIANFAGQMLTGGLTVGSVAATRALLDGGAHLAGNWLAPFTEAGRERLAGQRIAGAATDINAVHAALENAATAQEAAAKLRGIVADPQTPAPTRAFAQTLLAKVQQHTGELVPGSQPTTYQLTGDQGLGALERVAAKDNSDAFLGRMAAQNRARVGALDSLAPENASPEAIGQAVRQHLSGIDAQHEAQIEAARSAAQRATEQLGGSVPVGGDAQTSALQGYGQRLRGGLAGLNDAERGRVSAMYDAIDPDGTLAVDMTPVRQAARDVAKSLPKNAKPMEGDAARVLSTMQMLPRVQAFRELQALRSRITTAMRDELYEHGRSPTYGTMTRLLRAVDEVLQTGVEQRAAEDAAAVASGTKAPEDTILGRIEAAQGNWHGSSIPLGTAAAGSGGIRAGENAGTGAAAVPGLAGEQGARSGRYGTAPGNRSVAAAAGTPGRQPESLVDYLIAKGGIRDQGGDLKAIGADAVHHKAGGRLVNPRGLTLDQARELAEGEGFLRPDSTISDLLDALGEHISGRPVYRIHEQAEGTLHFQTAREAEQHWAAMERAGWRVSQIENEAGLRLTQAEHDHAALLVANGMHPEEAVRSVASGGDEAVLQRNAERNAFGYPGMPAAAEQTEIPVAPELRPNFNAEAAGQYRAANAAHRGRVSTFEEAPGVGQVLATGKHAGEWKLGDSQVAASVFTSGKGAAERVQAFLKAGGHLPALVSDLKDYAAFSLRRAAEEPDGTLNRAKVAKWLNDHAEALSPFPELRQQFENAATARRVMDDAVQRHVEARKAFEQSAAAKFLGDADPVLTIGRLLRSDGGAAQMRDLMRRAGFNPAAKAGMRRAAVDFILNELRSNALAGDMRGLKPDQFQTFVRRATPALRELFTPEQVDSIRAVADDIQRAQKSVSGTKLPGGSNTAQDLAAGEKHGSHRPSTIGLLVGVETAGEAVQHVLGPFGRVGGMVVAAIGNAMRQSGLHKVNDLVAEAMLNPGLARSLLAKVPAERSAPGYARMVAGQIKALSVNAAIGSERRQPAPASRGSGGLATPASAPRVSAWQQLHP